MSDRIEELKETVFKLESEGSEMVYESLKELIYIIINDMEERDNNA